jgi:PTH1 family peptidyl-tRNA hydrolase
MRGIWYNKSVFGIFTRTGEKYMLFARKSGGVDFVVVGLGNPGMAYEHTRHNAGYDALCVLADRHHIALNKTQFKALTGVGSIGDKKVLLMFPQTFMNNSGEAVQAAMAFYKLTPDRLLVLSDDISLDVGGVRVRKKGSDGGQKGLRSITTLLGTQEFPRIKIGVGAKPHPDYDMADWVLSEFSKDERVAIASCFPRAFDGVVKYLAGDPDGAVQVCNSK